MLKPNQTGYSGVAYPRDEAEQEAEDRLVPTVATCTACGGRCTTFTEIHRRIHFTCADEEAGR